jgi:hypothetical protein
MWPISRELTKNGHRTSLFSYATHKGDLEEHAAALVQHVQQFVGESAFAMVGHSLGGLLTHTAVPQLHRAPKRLVFVATPHNGCIRAKKARKALYAPLFTGPARNAAHGVSLGHHGISTGVIYGRKDKLVLPEEALLPGVPSAEVPYGHNDLLLRSHTARAICRFIETGAFEEAISAKGILG